MGSRTLLVNFDVRLADGEKLGFLGRNGAGKTTLFNLIDGKDKDYDGIITMTKNISYMTLSQEHHERSDATTLEHVTSRLPRYSALHNILETYPHVMGNDMNKMHTYSEALEEFSRLGYYDVENSMNELLDAYQLDNELLNHTFVSLSGGQKRLIELITIQLAEPQLALLDEPTNHMDYVAKAAFVDWLKKTKSTVMVISHDRDVLKNVERVVELKDLTSHSYPGNYDKYLYQNAIKTTNAIHAFEVTEKHIKNIGEQIAYANTRAPGYRGKAGKNPWVVMRERLERELKEIHETHIKPSFWIDKDSTEMLKPKAIDSYHKYKAKNIKLHKADGEETSSILLKAEDLSLGYDGVPLFQDLNFIISGGERLHVIGRNGAGKTTLVKAIMDAVDGKKPDTLIGKGIIDCARALRISQYEQEIGPELLEMTLFDAIGQIYADKGLPVNDQSILRDMGNYLFDPITDKATLVKNLSGGQKARLQLIRLLVGDPNLLILDEPTNHLDLPSIEELETALQNFPGAVIYISHDSYFAKKIGGHSIIIGK